MKHKNLKFTKEQYKVIEVLKFPTCSVLNGFFLNKSLFENDNILYQVSKNEKIEICINSYRFSVLTKVRNKLGTPSSLIYTNAECYVNSNGDTFVYILSVNLKITMKYVSGSDSPFVPANNSYLYSIDPINFTDNPLYTISDLALFNFIENFGLTYQESSILTKIVMSYYKNEEFNTELIEQISKRLQDLHTGVKRQRDQQKLVNLYDWMV